VDVEVDPAAAGALVPPMILQPLVENAVRHAVVPRASGGAIGIVAMRENGFLRLGVEDDGPGANPGAAEGSSAGSSRPGLGLANTRERLAELYGASAEVRFGQSSLGGLAVSLRLPYRQGTSPV
jgi:sensor histidine kinase YesM